MVPGRKWEGGIIRCVVVADIIVVICAFPATTINLFSFLHDDEDETGSPKERSWSKLMIKVVASELDTIHGDTQNKLCESSEKGK